MIGFLPGAARDAGARVLRPVPWRDEAVRAGGCRLRDKMAAAL